MGHENTALVDLEIVAVIAAAIAAVLDKPHRIVSVKKIEPPPHSNVWAFEGRIEINHSPSRRRSL